MVGKGDKRRPMNDKYCTANQFTRRWEKAMRNENVRLRENRELIVSDCCGADVVFVISLDSRHKTHCICQKCEKQCSIKIREF